MKPSQWFGVCKKAVVAWSDDFAPSMGAAISYYTVFSLAPLLVLVIAVAGLVFGADAVQGQIGSQLSSLMGEETAEAVQGMVESASIGDRGIWASLVSIVVLIVGATSVFGELQSALDRIWHVPESKKPSGIWGVLRARVFSAGLILCLAFLLMVSLSVSAGLAAFGSFIGGLLPGQEVLLQALNLAVSFGVMTVLFALIFKLMPTTRVEWRDVWVGAAITALLFEVGKFAIGLYLGKSDMASSFAGAGSLVILLVWVYYAAQIFLLGAEFTKVYADGHGSQKDTPKAPASEGASASNVPTKSSNDGIGIGGANVPNPAVAALGMPPHVAALQARRDLDRGVGEVAAGLLPRVALLAVLAALRTFTDRRLKTQHRGLRRARRSARR